METLPEEVLQAWKKREGAVVFTTVSKDGIPNSIYVTCVEMYKDHQIVIADNYFCKTGENIRSGSTGVALFITAEGQAYQIKGDISYYDHGDYYDFMKSWNPKQHPGHGAVVITPSEVFTGAKKLN